MNKNLFLFLKQGIKSLFKNKLQLFILMLLTLLSTSFLTGSISAYRNISNLYQENFENEDNANYYETEKMYNSDSSYNPAQQPNSFTPIYDILPTYIYMSDTKDFNFSTSKYTTQYEIFFNNDMGVYTDPTDPAKTSIKPLLLNPFDFLYNFNNSNWLGLNSLANFNLMQISFSSNNQAQTDSYIFSKISEIVKNYLLNTNINATSLLSYINNYIDYKNTALTNPIIDKLNNSVFKYSLIAEYINKNYKILSNKDSKEYENLKQYITVIATNISSYISNSLTKLYTEYTEKFVSAWNNNYYKNLNLGTNAYDILQDDINGKLYQNYNIGINKSKKALPIKVNNIANTVEQASIFDLTKSYNYITGMKSGVQGDDPEYIKPLFNNINNVQTYNDTLDKDNIIIDNVEKQEFNTGTKGLSSPIIKNDSDDKNSKLDIWIENSNDSLTYYSGFDEFHESSHFLYTAYEQHKFYATELSNFTLKDHLKMIIADTKITYILETYNCDYTNNISKQNEMENLVLYKGSMPDNPNEAVISIGYAQKNHIKIGSTIKLGINTVLKISGFGIDPLDLYPLIDTTSPIPSIDTQAIIYVNQKIIDDIDSTSSNVYATSEDTYYYHNGGENNQMQNDYLNLNAFIARSGENLDIYNAQRQAYATNSKSVSNEQMFRDDLSITDFDSSKIPLYEKTLFKTTDKYFLIIVMVVTSIILIISILATIIITRNNIYNNASQISILKALGIKKQKIIITYTMFSNIILLAIPFGFLIGIFLQIIFIHDFAKFFSIPENHLIIGWQSLITSFLAIGIFTILTGIIVSLRVINKSTITTLQTNIEYKKTPFSEKIDSLLQNKKFKTRFKFNMAYSSIRKLFMMGGVMLFSSITITLSLILPSIIATISNQYYEEEKFANSISYQDPVFNAPLSKLAINNWVGADELNKNWVWNDSNNDSSDGEYGNFKSIDNYYQISNNSSLFPPFMRAKYNDNYSNWKWTGDTVSSQPTSDVLNLILQSCLYTSGKSIGNWSFDLFLNWCKKYYGEDSIQYQNMKGLFETIIPTIINTIFQYKGTSTNWRDQIINAIVNDLPSYVTSNLQNESSKEIFNVGWNFMNYIPKDDTLITQVNDPITINNQSYDSLTEIGLPKNQKAINLSSDQLKNIFNDNDAINQLQSNNSDNKVIIPVVATEAAKIHFQLKANDLVLANRIMQELQFKTKSNTYGEVDPSWWLYANNHDISNTKSLYDYNNKTGNGDEFDTTRATYYNGSENNMQLGYAKWDPQNNKFVEEPYYNPKNIVLKIPRNAISDINTWTGAGVYNNDGISNNSVYKSDSKYYYFFPFDYDISPNVSEENNPIQIYTASNSTNSTIDGWYHYALVNKLLKVQNYDTNTYVDKNDSTVNHNTNIYYKITDFVPQYDNNNFYMDQAAANLVMGYDTNKINFYDYSPTKQRDQNATLNFDPQAKLYKDTTDEPYIWFNGKLSNNENLYDRTTYFAMNSTQGDYSAGILDSLSASSIKSTIPLSQTKGLVKTVTDVGLSLTVIFIISIIICSIILVVLISSMFIDENIKFMTLMKSIGYKRREIINYLLGIFTPIVLIAFLVGYFFTIGILNLTFFIAHNIYKVAVPYEYKIWTLFVALAIILLIYSFSFILANYRLKKFNILTITQ